MKKLTEREARELEVLEAYSAVTGLYYAAEISVRHGISREEFLTYAERAWDQAANPETDAE